VGVLLALASALCYGLSDFAGGLLARRASFVAVALTGQLGGLLLMLLVAPMVPTVALTPSDLGWGALSGVGTGLGMLYLFRGLGRGAMSVVVPVSAVGGVALPVLVGVALLGDRPAFVSWLGIAVAIPALWLVSRPRTRDGSVMSGAAADGLLASVGIALQYIALAQVGPGSGIWPVVAGRVAAAVTILLFARSKSRGWPRLSWRNTSGAVATGASAALALVLYLLATRQQIVTIAVVLSSLYPVVPVLLGIVALRERLSWRQVAGLVAALVAVGLVTAS